MILNHWLKIINKKFLSSIKLSNRVRFKNKLIPLRSINLKGKRREEELNQVLDTLFIYIISVISSSIFSKIEERSSSSWLCHRRLRSFSHRKYSLADRINMILIFRRRTIVLAVYVEQFLNIFLNNTYFSSIDLNLSKMLEITIFSSWCKSL